MQHSKRIDFAKKLIVTQGDSVAAALTGEILVEEKSPKDYVTQVDREIEASLDQAIQNQYPEDGFFGEEGTERGTSSAYEWIIDPVDGTNNFMRRIEWVGMNIALLFEDEVVGGVVYQPTSGRLYYSERGSGAWVQNLKTGDNPIKLRVSKLELEEGLLIYESAIVNNRRRSREIFLELIQRVKQVRMPGVAAYEWMFIAGAQAEILAYDRPKAVDVAAGTLIVEEAGGVVTDFAGKPWNRHMNGILAGNPSAHAAALEIVKRYADLDE